jgi:6-phosphogluconolactonase
MSAASQLIFVGTYTPKESTSRGIYAVRLDTATGALSEPVLAAETPNPTFLALHPNGRILYALGDSSAINGVTGGAAVAFNLDPGTSKLTPLNSQPTGGGPLAYIAIDATGGTIITISYHGGQITSFPINADGSIGPRQSAFTSTGPLGPNTARQDKPHPHSVTLSPDNRFAYVCDLGRDKIICCRVDPASAKLTPNGEFSSAPGAGPRHSKFSADGRFFYVIDELNGTIALYNCDPITGALTPHQSVSTLPDDFTGANTTAEIRIHPNGMFVYGSNRGHDSLAVFARHPTDGTLKRIQIISSGGAHPRNFNLSPDGNWLICANRDTNNLVVFKVDPVTGLLTATGHTLTVPQAVCVLFAPVGI